MKSTVCCLKTSSYATNGSQKVQRKKAMYVPAVVLKLNYNAYMTLCAARSSRARPMHCMQYTSI